MAQTPEQNYANHAKFVIGFHVVSFFILVANLIWSAYRLFRSPSADTVMALLVAIALGFMLYYLRAFALRAQDRIIRLEERLRLARVLPADLAARVEELRPRHLIALRFASDGEVAELVRAVFAGELDEPKAIKQRIRQWRPDHFRL